MGVWYSYVFTVINCELMVSIKNKIILWTGERHCGKTTSAARLVQMASNEGFKVSGLLALCVCLNGRLVGFDVLDLRSNNRAPLSRRTMNKGKDGPFNFIIDGLKLGNAALRTENTKSADLIIVDEFGPLELKGDGWRRNVDSLLVSSDAVILLVVRKELVDAVRQLYAKFSCRELAATDVDSIDEVIKVLKNHRCQVEEQNVQA